MDNNTIANRLVNIAAQIGSVVAARQIAAAKQSARPVIVNQRTVRKR